MFPYNQKFLKTIGQQTERTSIVCAASLIATSRGMPNYTPPSANDSITMNIYMRTEITGERQLFIDKVEASAHAHFSSSFFSFSLLLLSLL
jgi:hypothetical protein